MRRAYCEDCGAQRPFRRAFGWGTFFAAVVTAGMWLLALPFYPLRCTQCGKPFAERATSTPKPSPTRPPRPWSGRDWLILAVLIAAILVVGVLAIQGR